MDYKSGILNDSWRAVYHVEPQPDATNLENLLRGPIDIYGATPNFNGPKSNSVLVDNFCAELEPHCQDVGLLEDVNPYFLSLVDSAGNEDYFSGHAHSFAHLSPKPHRSPPSAIRESSPPSNKDTPMKVTKRKSGRPRKTSLYETTSSSSNSPTDASVRVPHNQVERKYRHSLNSEMARLRLAIPKIAEWDTDPNTTLKPSKAMVLASAVSYIQELEKERDSLRWRQGVF